MSYYINMFFSAEITCLPRIVDSYVGKYYSNAAGNTLTWVFVMWILVHYVFDSYLNIFFKQMHYKPYVCARLLNALWFSGFYGTAFLYCLGTVVKNNSSLAEYKKNLVLDGGPIPVHILMGLGLLGTFFFQSCIWRGIQQGFDKECFTYLVLAFLPIMTYYSRRTELFLSLLALISIVHFLNNILRCLSCTTGKKPNRFLNGMFFAVLGAFTLIHVVAVPIFFILPLVYNLRHGLNVPVILLAIFLTLWWVCEAFSNPLYKYIEHWIKHSELKNARICPENVLECALFPARDDLSFNMAQERVEMRQRESKSIQRRKPRDRGVLVQTLKCMVAIRRKLNRKRASESSDDSDSDAKAARDDGNEADTSDDESSSSEEEEGEDVERKMQREYMEETARALLEDAQDQREASGAADAEQASASCAGEQESGAVVRSCAHQGAEDKDKKND